MEKAGERMTWKEKEASNKREERFIELGKDGSLKWIKNGPPAWWYDDNGKLKEDMYPAETIIGRVKGHRVVINKLARVTLNFDRDYEYQGPYTYEGSVDGDVNLSARDAGTLFQKYSGITTDVEMEQLKEKAGESVEQKSAVYRKEQVISELLGE